MRFWFMPNQQPTQLREKNEKPKVTTVLKNADTNNYNNTRNKCNQLEKSVGREISRESVYVEG